MISGFEGYGGWERFRDHIASTVHEPFEDTDVWAEDEHWTPARLDEPRTVYDRVARLLRDRGWVPGWSYGDTGPLDLNTAIRLVAWADRDAHWRDKKNAENDIFRTLHRMCGMSAPDWADEDGRTWDDVLGLLAAASATVAWSTRMDEVRQEKAREHLDETVET